MRLRTVLVTIGLTAVTLSLALGGTATADDDPQFITVFTPPPICSLQNGSSMLAMINPSADHC
ncbi:hypothetical protein [Streptomyces sp. NPDC002559]